MRRVKNGDKVKLHYTGTLRDGRIFDTTREGQPFEFTVGNGMIMVGIEKAVMGMVIGESKIIYISPEKAFGHRHDELVAEVMKSDLPNHIKPTIGQKLRLRLPDGNVINVTTADLNEDTVTLDANHPLAGFTLLYDIELVAIS